MFLPPHIIRLDTVDLSSGLFGLADLWRPLFLIKSGFFCSLLECFVFWTKSGNYPVLPLAREPSELTNWGVISLKDATRHTYYTRIYPIWNRVKEIRSVLMTQNWQVMYTCTNEDTTLTNSSTHLIDTVRPATALTSLALILILHYFELVSELLLQHYFLKFYLPSTALFWHASWWKEIYHISFLWLS